MKNLISDREASQYTFIGRIVTQKLMLFIYRRSTCQKMLVAMIRKLFLNFYYFYFLDFY